MSNAQSPGFFQKIEDFQGKIEQFIQKVQNADWKKIFSGFQLVLIVITSGLLISGSPEWGYVLILAALTMLAERRAWEACITMTVAFAWTQLTANQVVLSVGKMNGVDIALYLVLAGLALLQLYQLGKK